MKKAFFVLVLVALVGTGAFAQVPAIDMSVGGGMLLDMSFGNGTRIEGIPISSSRTVFLPPLNASTASRISSKFVIVFYPPKIKLTPKASRYTV